MGVFEKRIRSLIKIGHSCVILVTNSRLGHFILEVNWKIRYKINLEHSYLIKSGCSAVDILAMIQYLWSSKLPTLIIET